MKIVSTPPSDWRDQTVTVEVTGRELLYLHAVFSRTMIDLPMRLQVESVDDAEIFNALAQALLLVGAPDDEIDRVEQAAARAIPTLIGASE